MPLPVLHSYVGYSLYKYSFKNEKHHDVFLAGLFIFLANMADFDIIPSMMMGEPVVCHRSYMHSFGFAFIASGLATLMARPFLKDRSISSLKLFLGGLAAYFSHVFLDFFTGNVAYMFWPFNLMVAHTPVLPLLEHHPLVDYTSVEQYSCDPVVRGNTFGAWIYKIQSINDARSCFFRCF